METNLDEAVQSNRLPETPTDMDSVFNVLIYKI